MPNGPLRPPSFNASGGPPNRPMPLTSLRSLSVSDLPENATQSQRAQRSLQETLDVNFFKLIIIWSFLFLTMTCTYFGCLIWAFSVFGFGKVRWWVGDGEDSIDCGIDLRGGTGPMHLSTLRTERPSWIAYLKIPFSFPTPTLTGTR